MLNKTDLARVDLNLLVLFEVVLEERHVARAATRLHLSPSAISHGLSRLRALLHDPLFLRHPKGVVPTERALMLAAPVADILARARNVVGSAEPFDPAKSARRFTIGAPDGASAVLLPPLLAHIRTAAPGVDLSVRNLVGQFERSLVDLDERTLDIAVVPLSDVPARFVLRKLYDEDFVIVKRAGHPLSGLSKLKRYAEALHLVVSLSGDPHGLVDRMLSEHGLTRRVALTVPNFLMALAIVSESDLIAALPRHFVAMHAGRYPVQAVEPPVPLLSAPICAIAPRVATMDAGISWLLDVLEQVAARSSKVTAPKRRAPANR
jgi:DNA-binding transcriptional LysR family regulator